MILFSFFPFSSSCGIFFLTLPPDRPLSPDRTRPPPAPGPGSPPTARPQRRRLAPPCPPPRALTAPPLAAPSHAAAWFNSVVASYDSGRDGRRRRWPGWVAVRRLVRALHRRNFADLRRDCRRKGTRGAKLSAYQLLSHEYRPRSVRCQNW
jgi:hypothetical protein